MSQSLNHFNTTTTAGMSRTHHEERALRTVSGWHVGRGHPHGIRRNALADSTSGVVGSTASWEDQRGVIGSTDGSSEEPNPPSNPLTRLWPEHHGESHNGPLLHLVIEP